MFRPIEVPEERKRMNRIFGILALIALTAVCAGEPAWAQKKEEAAKAKAPSGGASVLRVNVASQAYDFSRPWLKKAPFMRSALGAVLPGNRVLITAEMVANHNYVELEKAETGEKVPATVLFVDYESNLALLKANEDAFMKDLKPLELTLDTVVGDRMEVLQLESNGILATTEGTVSTIEVSNYPEDNSYFLCYRLSLSLQYRDSSFALPVVKNGKLAGLLMRYDTRTQNGMILPAPIIKHFLDDVKDGNYAGFPQMGFTYASLRDPQLRRYAKTSGTGGVYVAEVVPDSPAGKSGLKQGDVILEINGLPVDQDGNYSDPQYRKLEIEHLLTGKGNVGDKVKLKVLRESKEVELEFALNRRLPEDYVSAPYVLDKAPRYFVVGGMIFQELSRQYLKQWGGNWQGQAPQKLVYYDEFQSQLFGPDQKKVVILSQVLPSDATVGLERLGHLVVTQVNGQKIHSLDDLKAAVEKPVNGFHKIEFLEDPKQIYLDAEQVKVEESKLRQNYNLPIENLK